MGADRHIILKKKMTFEIFEKILNENKISFYRWNESYWNDNWKGWKTVADIELEGGGKELQFHYGYCGAEHETESELEADLIIRILSEQKLVEDIGDWAY